MTQPETSCSASGAAPRFPVRRGACPSLVNPMPTGDGLLVRLRPAAAGLTPGQWGTLADLARTFGNGLLDVTARGNLQIRGLAHQDAAQQLSAELSRAGIEIRSGTAVETPPLAGLDCAEVADASGLADQIRDAIRQHTPALALAPKLAITVNGGGLFNLSDAISDLRLDAVRHGGQVLWRIALAGDARTARPVALVDEAQAVSHVIALLELLHAQGSASRGRDIAALVPALDEACFPAELTAGPVNPAGVIRNGSSAVLGLRLAFGRMHAGELESLMAGLSGLGATQVRLAPDHALLVLGLPDGAIPAAARLAAEQGFITRPDDPMNSVSACPGTGFCAAGRLDTQELAGLLASQAPDLLDGSCTVHLSGCTKGCAHPSPAPLTVTGTDAGLRIVLAGRAGDAADLNISLEEFRALLPALQQGIAQHRQAGQTAAQALSLSGAAIFGMAP
ncbi:precorrin-3B synthase [Pannonibacter sp. Pt2]|uniref:Precorrin-3B synthase n=1 Tax=Pannonibacter anstelovis TaxID=3121537 RepID=A0ABU7ZKY5_9HYPH